jgi:hypothetical protein
VYGDEVGGIDMACTSVFAAGDRGLNILGRGTCHPGFPDENALSFATQTFWPRYAVHGVVRSDVASLWVERPGQRRSKVEILPPPDGIEHSISFFVFQIPFADSLGEPLTMIAEDAQGNTIQERTMTIGE